MSNKIKLTKQSINSLPFPSKGNKITLDTDVPGFGIRVTAAGAKSFILRYRFENRDRQYTIGNFPTWTATAAREEARVLRREIDQGINPLAERIERREAPTVNDLWLKYKEEHLIYKKSRSADDDKSMWMNYILPAFKNEKLGNLTKDQIAKFHREITNGTFKKEFPARPTRANRVIEVFRKAFSLAIEWEMLNKNPCSSIKMNPETQRDRYADDEELKALSIAMKEHENQDSCDVIRLLMLTGARKNEVLSAEWEHFDLINESWTKPAANTKQGKKHSVPLSGAATELLKRRYKERETDWVFPSPFTDGHLTDIKRTWATVRDHAAMIIWKSDPELKQMIEDLAEKLGKVPSVKQVMEQAKELKIKLPVATTDLKIHDLRHTYASILISKGHDLPLIGSLLGHSQIQTTQRYAHLMDEPQRDATNQVGDFIDI